MVVADIEGWEDREEVAADIAAHMMAAKLALDELHGGEDRPLRAAGAEGRRARLHLAVDGEHRGFARIIALGRTLLGEHVDPVARHEFAHALADHRARIFAG